MFDEQMRIYVMSNGKVVKLTPQEASVLSILIEHKGYYVKKPDIFEAMYGFELTNAEDIERIRCPIKTASTKLKEELSITAKRGVGYKVTYKE